MLMKVFAIRDRAADCFGRPFFQVSTGAAIRSFSDGINEPGSDFGKHPEDFDLYEFGVFNDADGSWNVSAPKQVAVGKDLVRSVN